MTSEKPIPLIYDRTTSVGAIDLHKRDAATHLRLHMAEFRADEAEENVRHELRSLGGKNAAKGEGGRRKREIRADWPKLIDQGIPANKAVHKLAKKYKLTAPTVRKHVQDLR